MPSPRNRLLRALTFCVLFLAATLPAGPAMAASLSEEGPGAALRRATGGLSAALVPSGVLYDRVLPMSGIEAYDGGAGAPAPGIAVWRQILHEMTLASLAEPAWPSAAELRAETSALRQTAVVPLGLLDFRYDRIRPEALAQGLFFWDGDRLVEAPGATSEALYEGARVFAAAALSEKVYQGASIHLLLEARHLLSNRAERPVSLEIDGDDGLGFRPLHLDEPLPLSYQATGTRTLILRARYADGGVLTSRFLLDVIALITPAPDETWPLTASIPYNGVFAGGEAFIYRGAGHAAVEDPVIVVEGFDLDNSMSWEELYTLLNQESLLETLRAEGYDAVILNFDESPDFIQRNAYLLVELIDQVKSVVAPDRDLMVVGASMGGLVARYALTYMEDQGLEHHARGFLSFDSPQNGANIPLGLQYWLDLFRIESTEAEYLLSRLNMPAARQMLIYHYTAPPGPTGESDPMRGQLDAELAALGDYPSLPRKAAVANGSGAGQNQGFNPGDQIIFYEYSNWFVDLIGNVWAVPDGGSQLILNGLIDRIWPFSDDQLVVPVAGTLPWDGAPGGSRASMAELAATEAPYGDIIALHDKHCFIPTVSALDLDTADPFFDIAGAPDLPALSPFDALYFPAENQEHVLVTAESKEWLLGEIRRDLTAVGEEPDPAASPLALLASYPNPFNPATTIRFELAESGWVDLAVFDLGGRRLKQLVSQPLGSGPHEIAWDGRDELNRAQGSGVYLCRLEALNRNKALKLVILK